ncbi:MAG: VanW family protein [Lachnospiraceae bacterium]|nr:VanW family protein [Lachnospiraceae bacterium]
MMALLICLFPGLKVQAASNPVIHQGVYAENIDLSGLTKEQAKQKIESYVEGISQTPISLKTVSDNTVTVTAADLGLTWKNKDIVDKAVELGKTGNVVSRYKQLKDLETHNQIYELELTVDTTKIENLINEHCLTYNIPAKDFGLTRENGEFQVVEGQIGYEVNVSESVDKVATFMTEAWDGAEATVDLVIVETTPRGSREELMGLTDILGTYTTSYTTSGSSRSANVANGCRLINGTLMYPGDSFSTLAKITPFSEANGYYLAGSYLNGTVVETLGGGICQVSTTLYNAVLRSELEVTNRSCHSMIINYVKPSEDAAISESGGKDFEFVNNLDHPIYIEGYTENKHITFNIYGVETRDPGHSVEYLSEILETYNPTGDVINQNAGLPVGYISVQSVHIGYKAQLWKIVKENGNEVSREVINTSYYKLVPRTAVVGTATDNPTAAAMIQAAIATGSIDEVKAAIAAIQATPAPTPVPETTETTEAGQDSVAP